MHLFIGAETLMVPQDQGRPVGGGWIEWKRKKLLSESYWTSPDIAAAISDLGMETIVFVPDAFIGLAIERDHGLRWCEAPSMEDREATCRTFQPVGRFAWLDNFHILNPVWTYDGDDDILLLDIPSYVRRFHLKTVRDWVLK